MNARFQITTPDLVSMTLTLTDDMIGWKVLRDDLIKLGESGSPAGILAKQISHMIDESRERLSNKNWTTGYAKGVATDEAPKNEG